MAHPRIHTLADTTGIGFDHRTSGLTAGMTLQATAADDCAFAFGVNLGTTGTFESSVADGASAVAFQFNDNVARTQGYAAELTNTISSNNLLRVAWDGRYWFGYDSTSTPQTGHVLSFLQSDANSPTGAPHYAGILAFVTHADAAETVSQNVGVVGAGSVGTATGYSANHSAGVVGVGVGAADSASFSAKTLAGVVGRLTGVGTVGDMERDLDSATGNARVKGDWGFAACLYGEYMASNTAKGHPTNRPDVVAGVISNIPGWSATTGEQWAFYGKAPTTGSPATPAVSGGISLPFPARGTRALHAHFEPKAAAASGPTGNAKGDTYFDDGTNNTIGLHEYDGTAWRKLLTRHNVVSKTTTYTITYEDQVVLCDATSGAFTVTLPAAANLAGYEVHIKKIDSSANAVTVDGSGAETIDDNLTVVLASQYDSIRLTTDGTEWFIL